MSNETDSWLYPEPLPAILYGHPDYDKLMAGRAETQAFMDRVLVPFLITKYGMPDDDFSVLCIRRIVAAEARSKPDVRRKRVTLSGSRRKSIHLLYGSQCAACRASDPRMTVDHIVPLALGGCDATFNLQILCHQCNEDKAALTMTAWMEGRQSADLLEVAA